MHHKTSLIYIALLLFPGIPEASDVCAQWIAKIVSVQGRVETQTYGESGWRIVHQNYTFCAGDKIRTLRNSRVTLEIRNQSLTTLNQKTTLSFSKPSDKKAEWWMNLFKGDAFFRSRRHHNLEIRTPFVNAVHEGTEFLVAVNDRKTEITVFDGQVAAVNKSGKIQIDKGFMGIAEKGTPTRILPITVRPEDAVQWTLYYPSVIDYGDLPEAALTSTLQKVIALVDQGQYFQALNKLESLPSSEQSVHVLNLQASLLLNVGQIDAADSIISRILQLDPENSNAYALKAIIYVTKNRPHKALELARQAVEFNPKSASAQIALSYAYQSQFLIQQSLKAAREATERAPDNALAWARLAELQLATGERGHALTSAEKAKSLNPSLAKTHIILGFAQLSQINIASAESEFSEAVSLNSASPLARLGLGLVKIRKGDLEEGAHDLEIAVSLDPDNSLMRSYLGKAYYELKNSEFASTEYTLAKELDPNDPTPWAYDAILKQANTQPVAALHDIEKAIELNDNRSVYRSRLLLDEDLSIRGTSLARIYDDLGFDQVAILEASKSLDLDPTNHSAHRFLSDSYLTQPRQEIAQASELLQSQLLQPVNLNPIQPRLAVTDLNIPNGVGPAENTFNEYYRAFDGNGVQFNATGLFGNDSTFGDEAVLSGIYNKFSYSLGQLYYSTDGFRENNGLEHKLYNVFTQYAFSPKFNAQFEYRYRKTQHGDLELSGNPDNFNESLQRKLNQDTYRLGFKFSPEQHSDILVSAIYSDRFETASEDLPFPFTERFQTTQNKGYQLESQYIFHSNYVNLLVGGGANVFDIDDNLDLGFLKNISSFTSNHYLGYLYSDINLIKDLTATLGVSYDSYQYKQGEGLDVSSANPKFGLRWNFHEMFTLRLAAFRTVKTNIVVNQLLQPTQVAGFNQFYDDLNGTKAMQYGIGLDTQFSNNLNSGLEVIYRDLKTPGFQPQDNNFSISDQNESLYRLYLNWILSNNWVFNSEFRFEKFNGTSTNEYQRVGTAFLPLNLNYYHQLGIFAELGGTYVHQHVESERNESFNSDFFLADAAIGYRFPKQYGLISFEAKNLFDRKFTFRDRNFQLNEIRKSEITPERTFLARITFNY